MRVVQRGAKAQIVVGVAGRGESFGFGSFVLRSIL